MQNAPSGDGISTIYSIPYCRGVSNAKKYGIVENKGGVAEWSKAAVLKTVVGKPTGGSNPSASAVKI
jgi:hypothetical protein